MDGWLCYEVINSLKSVLLEGGGKVGTEERIGHKSVSWDKERIIFLLKDT